MGVEEAWGSCRGGDEAGGGQLGAAALTNQIRSVAVVAAGVMSQWVKKLPAGQAIQETQA